MIRAPKLRQLAHASSLALVVFALAACGESGDADKASQSKTNPAAATAPFRILAGSELKEVAPLLEASARAAGIDVAFSYAGTLDIVDRINDSGPAAALERFDAILPPNGAYPSLALTNKPLAREKLFYSRVALGVRGSRARALGWDHTAPTWSQIAQAAKDGQFVYGMTNPTTSNTGMSALFAVASAVAGKTEDLSVAEVNRSVLKDFLSGQKLTAGSSGWLADAYLKEQDRAQDRLDGLINYEAVLLRMNADAALREKLVVIYPRDGVISADYPLSLLNDTRRDDYNKLVAAWRQTEFQQRVSADAFLRPANPDAKPAASLPSGAVAELAFPNRLEVIDAVLVAYQGELRRPATSIFVLDTSGSMQGARMAALQESLRVLSGADSSSLSARFARFQQRERVVLMTFSGAVQPPVRIGFDDAGGADQSASAAARDKVRRFADGLQANGGTAIYSALASAYQLGSTEASREPGRVVSIVLLTDGENNSGMSQEDFMAMVERVRGQGRTVRIFPIVFGEASSQALEQIAQATGGRAFDGRRANLAAVFKEIRGYQ